MGAYLGLTRIQRRSLSIICLATAIAEAMDSEARFAVISTTCRKVVCMVVDGLLCTSTSPFVARKKCTAVDHRGGILSTLHLFAIQ